MHLSFRFDRNNAFACIRSFLDVSLQINKRHGGTFQYTDCFQRHGHHGLGKCGVINSATHLSLSELGMKLQKLQREVSEDIFRIFQDVRSREEIISLRDDLLEVTDDSSCSTRHGNFLNFSQNDHGVKVRRKVLEMMGEKVYPLDQYISMSQCMDTSVSMDELRSGLSYARRIADTCESIMKRLLFLMHIVGGGPGRGTELATLKLRNTAKAPRNFFIIQGLLCISTEDNKPRNRKGAHGSQKIIRVLDRVSSGIACLYLALVDPLHEASVRTHTVIQEHIIRNDVDRNLRNNSPLSSLTDSSRDHHFFWTWRSQRVDKKDVRIAINSIFAEIGIRLTIQTYRQWHACITSTNSIMLCDEMNYYNFMDNNRGLKLIETIHNQSGRSAAIGGRHYGLSRAKNIEGLTLRRQTAMRIGSQEWHRLLFGGKDVMEENRTLTKYNSCGPGGVAVFDQPWKTSLNYEDSNRFSSRPKSTEKRGEDLNRMKYDIVTGYRHETSGPFQATETFGMECSPYRDIVMHCRRHLQLMTSQVRAMFLSPCQERLVIMAFDKKADILAILGTGGGKSLSYMLPAYIDQTEAASKGKRTMVTIVVVPLVALTLNLIERSTNFGIRCATWNMRTEGDASLVFVAVEHLTRKEYSEYTSELVAERRLRCFVIEECHLRESWGRTFRQEICNVGNFIRPVFATEVPIVGLTATAPPAVEKALVQNLCMKSTTLILRESTIRPNIAFRVQTVKKAIGSKMTTQGLLCSKVLALLHEKVNDSGTTFSFEGNARAIVYFRSIAALQKCTDEFNDSSQVYAAVSYYADFDKRHESHESWKSGKHYLDEFRDRQVVVIMATQAFGLGIDYPQVRIVFHCELPNTVEEFVQESGRGGRDGCPAESIAIIQPGIERRNEESRTSQQHLRMILEQGEYCIRQKLFQFMDGSAEPCVFSSTRINERKAPEILCDNCARAVPKDIPHKQKRKRKMDIPNRREEKEAARYPKKRIRVPDVVENVPVSSEQNVIPAESSNTARKRTNTEKNKNGVRVLVMGRTDDRGQLSSVMNKTFRSASNSQFTNPHSTVRAAIEKSHQFAKVCVLCLGNKGVYVNHNSIPSDFVRSCPFFMKTWPCFGCVGPTCPTKEMLGIARHDYQNCHARDVINKLKVTKQICGQCGLPRYFKNADTHGGQGFNTRECKLGVGLRVVLCS